MTVMHWWETLFYHQGKLLGIDWTWWKVLGWTGNVVFFSRFLVQWYATEKLKRVVVPAAFWWLSLTGALLLLAYSAHKHDSVFIFAYAFTWIPYIRNLIIHQQHQEAHTDCPKCGLACPPHSNYCFSCGARLDTAVPQPAQG
jgi:lipid-A-disaccharide synthase-like uncharacterized protein